MTTWLIRFDDRGEGLSVSDIAELEGFATSIGFSATIASEPEPAGYLVMMDDDLDYFTESEHMARAHELAIHSALEDTVKTKILVCYERELDPS